MTIKAPSKQTLRKYGLTIEEWWAFIPDGVCPICDKEPPTGRMVIDHQHVRGWKNMSPEDRKKYVRGVVCTSDNHFVLTRYGTPLKFRNAADYLERYEDRRSREGE